MTRTTVVASEVITVSTTAKVLTASLVGIKGVNSVKIYVEAQPIRYWRSGKPPTSSQGFPLIDKDTLTMSFPEASRFQMIRSGGVDATVHVEYMIVEEVL